jgi:hypothetical protein
MKVLLTLAVIIIALFTSCKKEDDPQGSGCGTVMDYDVKLSIGSSPMVYYFDVKFHDTNKTETVKVSENVYYSHFVGDEVCF